MATIDDKVVAASFESSKFEQGVSKTISAVDKLKKSLVFTGVGKGFDDLEKSARNVDLSHIGKSVDQIKNKFSAFNAVATASIFNLTNRIINSGSMIAKSFTFSPVIDGLHEYENQLNSVQTILANTADQGTNLKDVNAALNQLNTYADKTIYNFGQMTKNIGTFTAAGVDLKTAVGSIKGISNLAALSGSSAEQASTAMYQLSQAISAGRVSLQDWNSVVNAGMGGAVFQKALMRTATAMGALKDGAVKIDKATGKATVNGQSFRESIMAKPGEKSWLSSDVLTNTLKQFSGDLSDAQLKAQGFNDAQIKAIKAQAKTALDAATKVKTFSQLMDTTKEAIGSGWAQTWQIVFGDFGEAKHLFTGLADSIGGMVKASAKARNNLLKDWKDLGGRTLLLRSLKIAFHDLQEVIAPIKKAFRDIFPPKTGKDLFRLTEEFHHLAVILKPSKDTVDNLRRIFRGLFAVLDIGKQIISGVWSGLKVMFGAMGQGSGNLLDLLAKVGDAIASFNQWLHVNNKISNFFQTIGGILSIPIKMIGDLANTVKNLVKGTDKISGLGDAFSHIGGAFSASSAVAGKATDAWQGFLDVLTKIYDVVQPTLSAIGDAFSNIGNVIADAIKNQNFDNVFSVIQTGLVAGIFLTLRKALTGGINFDFGGKAIKDVSKSLDILKGSLNAMQQTIRAATLLEIATAVGILAAAVVALTFVDPAKLSSAMTAITIGIGQLIGAMALLQKSGGKGFAKMPLIAASLILLATAVDTLAVAVVILSKLSWDELARGLAGVGGLLLGISIAVQPLSKASPMLAVTSVGLIGVAVAMNILAGAVKLFSMMSWEKMAQGMVGVVGSLLAIGLAVRAMPVTLPIIGAGLILLGVGLNAVAAAVKVFATMKWEDMGKGLAGMAASLVAIGLAMNLMPPTLPLTAAGLILVGVALAEIAGAIALMGAMDTGTLVKGIAGIGGALVVLAGGLTLMIASLPGAAALLVAAGALAILVPVIGIMGNLKWSTIGKGLGAIVGSMVALGVAGAIAAPGLIALGAALTVVGAGMTLVGAGVYLMASGLAKLAGDGAKGIGVTIAAFTAFVAILPKIIIDFIKGLVQIIKSIAEIAPEVVDALVKIGTQLVQVIIRLSPKMAQAAIALITAILTVLNSKSGAIIEAGWKLLLNLLKGINDHIVDATKTVATIVVKMLGALASKAGQLITAGYNMLIAILKGIANNFGRVVAAGVQIVTKLISGIISNIGRVVTAIVTLIGKIVTTIANAAKRFITTGGKIVANIVKGIGEAASSVVTAALKTVTKFITTITTQIPKEVDKVATAVIRMINALADVVRKRGPEFNQSLQNLGGALADEIVDGLTGIGGKVANKLKDELKKLGGAPLKLLKKGIDKVKGASAGGLIGLDNPGIDLANGLLEASPKVNAAASHLVASMAKTITLAGPQKKILNDTGAMIGHELFVGALGVVERDDALDQTLANINDKIGASITNLKQKIENSHKDIKKSAKKVTDAAKKVNDLDKKIIADQDRYKKAKSGSKAQEAARVQWHKDFVARNKAYKDYLKIAATEKAVQDKDTTAIIRNQTALDRLLDTQSELKNGFDDQKTKFHQAIVDLEAYTKAVDDAQQAVDDLKQQQADFAKSTAESFSNMPDITREGKNGKLLTGDQQLADFIKQLSDQGPAIEKYKSTLDQLRSLGLDDKTFQKLLSDGTVDQAFADALLKGGKAAIDQVNFLDTRIDIAAKALGDSASHSLYDAGIASAQGLVDGLTAKKNEIAQTMFDIANLIVNAIKKKLGIKSPSRVFAELGRYSALGMAKGLKDSSHEVTSAVYGITDDALSALKSGMAGISDEVAKQIDPNPTITPVLDLSQVQAGAAQIGGILGKPVASTSLANASVISVDQATAAEAAAQTNVAPIQFVQNNTSPKSLSQIDIYRQTKNQLAMARTVLSNNS